MLIVSKVCACVTKVVCYYFVQIWLLAYVQIGCDEQIQPLRVLLAPHILIYAQQLPLTTTSVPGAPHLDLVRLRHVRIKQEKTR